MRLAYKVWSGIAAGVFVLVAISDVSAAGSSSGARSSAAGATPIAASPSASPERSAVPAGTAWQDAAAGETVVVTRVVDGDTVEVTGGRTVQVLGIDACEAGTYGGDQATDLARSQLEGETVTLTREPGVDLDRHGHDLRYVAFSWGGDFGEYAVGFDHTTVYGGHGASEQYLARLRERDDGPQRCTAPAAAPSGGSGDGDINWPTPGDQGLPDGALTGGYCAKKWWC